MTFMTNFAITRPTREPNPMDSRIYHPCSFFTDIPTEYWHGPQPEHTMFCAVFRSLQRRVPPPSGALSSSVEEGKVRSGVEEGCKRSTLIKGVMASAQSRLDSSFHPQHHESWLPESKCG